MKLLQIDSKSVTFFETSIVEFLLWNIDAESYPRKNLQLLNAMSNESSKMTSYSVNAGVRGLTLSVDMGGHTVCAFILEIERFDILIVEG